MFTCFPYRKRSRAGSRKSGFEPSSLGISGAPRTIAAGIRSSLPMTGSAAAQAQGGAALARADLQGARVAPGPRRHGEGDRRGRDVGEPHDAALRLGDDFLADDEEVASGERRGLACRCLDEEARDVVTRPHLGDALDTDHLVARRRRDGAHGGRSLADLAPTDAHARTTRALSVVPPAVASAATSSGASTSRARPGRTVTRGSRPRARAAARWFWNEGSPNLSGIVSGGVSATPVVPNPEREGANAGAPSATAAASARISSAVTQGTSPGTVRKTRAPRRAASAWANATAEV